MSKKRNAINDTALHVLKGAAVTVLGSAAAVTASVSFSSHHKGSIVLRYNGGEITSQHEKLIENECNNMIQQNIKVNQFTMERKKAEEHYRTHLVNHTFIYDETPVAPEISELSLVEIPNVNINCCVGPHTQTTGELKHMTVVKIKSKGKGKIEILFAVGDDHGDKKSSDVTETKTTTEAAKPQKQDKQTKQDSNASQEQSTKPTAAAAAATTKNDDNKNKNEKQNNKNNKNNKNKKDDSKSNNNESKQNALSSISPADELTQKLIQQTLQTCQQYHQVLQQQQQSKEEIEETIRKQLHNMYRDELLAFQNLMFARGFNAKLSN